MITSKKIESILIIIILVVILISGISQGIHEVAPGQTVTGQISLGQTSDVGERQIEITAPHDVSGWNMAPGIVNEQKGTLHVKAKGSWQIKVSADRATKGFMSEYILDHDDITNGAYARNGQKLKNSMKIKAEGYNEVDLKDGGVLISYKGQANKWQTVDIPIIFKQEISWDEAPLSNGHIYHINIDFNPS